jgi:hypothetical protein
MLGNAQGRLFCVWPEAQICLDTALHTGEGGGSEKCPKSVTYFSNDPFKQLKYFQTDAI